MSKWRLLAAAAGMFLIHAAFNSSDARAEIIISSPWGSSTGFTAFVGMSGGVAKVVFQNHLTSACSSTTIGTASGLNNDYLIVGGNDTDFLIGVGGLASLYTVCGTSITPLAYNGHFLDMDGGSNTDLVFPGTGDSFGYGSDGDDLMQTFSPIGIILGGNGADDMYGTSAVTTDAIYGEGGDDCLTDDGNAHSTFDCGGQTTHDYYVSPASGAVSCEVSVSSC
jgi:hypothetical protein